MLSELLASEPFAAMFCLRCGAWRNKRSRLGGRSSDINHTTAEGRDDELSIPTQRGVRAARKDHREMGGPNLEIFKFALYIFTPIMTMRMFPLPSPAPSLTSPLLLHLPHHPPLLFLPPFLSPPTLAASQPPPGNLSRSKKKKHQLILRERTVYFGTNLDRRFAVPDFWPKPSETHRIPFEREEIAAEMERLKRRRLWLREQRLNAEASRRLEEGEEAKARERQAPNQ